MIALLIKKLHLVANLPVAIALIHLIPLGNLRNEFNVNFPGRDPSILNHQNLVMKAMMIIVEGMY